MMGFIGDFLEGKGLLVSLSMWRRWQTRRGEQRNETRELEWQRHCSATTYSQDSVHNTASGQRLEKDLTVS